MTKPVKKSGSKSEKTKKKGKNMDSIKKKFNKMKPSTSSESSDSETKKMNGKLIRQTN